jgi:hypothetical protein
MLKILFVHAVYLLQDDDVPMDKSLMELVQQIVSFHMKVCKYCFVILHVGID